MPVLDLGAEPDWSTGLQTEAVGSQAEEEQQHQQVLVSSVDLSAWKQLAGKKAADLIRVAVEERRRPSSVVARLSKEKSVALSVLATTLTTRSF